MVGTLQRVDRHSFCRRSSWIRDMEGRLRSSVARGDCSLVAWMASLALLDQTRKGNVLCVPKTRFHRKRACFGWRNRLGPCGWAILDQADEVFGSDARRVNPTRIRVNRVFGTHRTSISHSRRRKRPGRCDNLYIPLVQKTVRPRRRTSPNAGEFSIETLVQRWVVHSAQVAARMPMTQPSLS